MSILLEFSINMLYILNNFFLKNSYLKKVYIFIEKYYRFGIVI